MVESRVNLQFKHTWLQSVVVVAVIAAAVVVLVAPRPTTADAAAAVLAPTADTTVVVVAATADKAAVVGVSAVVVASMTDINDESYSNCKLQSYVLKCDHWTLPTINLSTTENRAKNPAKLKFPINNPLNVILNFKTLC